MKYDPALDGLRALAVGAVVIYHVDDALLPGGWAGVDVFFVLSGFLITSILQRELDQTGTINLMRFYLRRALRLTPALALLLIAAVIAGAFLHEFRRAVGASLFAATYTMNWNRAFGWGPQWALGHTWSLAMEEQFYLLWPALLLLLPRKSQLPSALIFTIIIVAWRCHLAYAGADAERTYNGFDTHADALLIGCLIRFIGEPRRLPGLPAISAAALAAIAAIFAVMPLHSILSQSLGLSVAALVSALLIICARREGWLRSIFLWRPLVFTGRISYGFYLWHYPLLLLMKPLLPKSLALLPVPLAYLLAIISFYTVEAYFQRMKDRLDKNRRPIDAPVSVTA